MSNVTIGQGNKVHAKNSYGGATCNTFTSFADGIRGTEAAVDCVRCIKIEKTAEEHRSRTEYYAGVAEGQDAVMSQAEAQPSAEDHQVMSSVDGGVSWTVFAGPKPRQQALYMAEMMNRESPDDTVYRVFPMDQVARPKVATLYGVKPAEGVRVRALVSLFVDDHNGERMSVSAGAWGEVARIEDGRYRVSWDDVMASSWLDIEDFEYQVQTPDVQRKIGSVAVALRDMPALTGRGDQVVVAAGTQGEVRKVDGQQHLIAWHGRPVQTWVAQDCISLPVQPAPDRAAEPAFDQITKRDEIAVWQLAYNTARENGADHAEAHTYADEAVVIHRNIMTSTEEELVRARDLVVGHLSKLNDRIAELAEKREAARKPRTSIVTVTAHGTDRLSFRLDDSNVTGFATLNPLNACWLVYNSDGQHVSGQFMARQNSAMSWARYVGVTGPIKVQII